MVRLAIAYLRVSTEEQRIGPQAQADAIARFAQSSNLTLQAFYLDRGISGAAPITERPALLATLHAIRLAPSTALIVAKRDRLARDVLLATTIERSLPRSSALFSADGTGNGSSPADALMRTIVDGMAQYERALIRARTSAALQSKIVRGECTGNPRIASSHSPYQAKEAHLVALVIQLATSGLSERAIVAHLSEQGITSPRSGNPYQRTQIRRILARDKRPATVTS